MIIQLIVSTKLTIDTADVFHISIFSSHYIFCPLIISLAALASLEVGLAHSESSPELLENLISDDFKIDLAALTFAEKIAAGPTNIYTRVTPVYACKLKSSASPNFRFARLG